MTYTVLTTTYEVRSASRIITYGIKTAAEAIQEAEQLDRQDGPRVIQVDESETYRVRKTIWPRPGCIVFRTNGEF